MEILTPNCWDKSGVYYFQFSLIAEVQKMIFPKMFLKDTV